MTVASPEKATASRPDERFFRPRRLGHANLWVRDIEKSAAFYRDVCGLTLEFSEPDLMAHFLGTGHTPHDLGMMQTTNGVDRYGRNGLLQLPGTVGLAPGLNHLAWELENEAELVKAFRRLKAAGVETDMTVDHQVAHSVYMFDPDNNYNEFYCDTVKDWRSVLHGEMELLTSSWDPLSTEGFTEGRYDEAPEIRVVPDALVQPRRVTHVVLATPQLAKMQDFYARVGGLDVLSSSGQAVYLKASHGGYAFSLVLVAADSPSYHHVSFELADEVTLDKALVKLRERQITVEREVDLPWKRSFFLVDPDGQRSEWYVARAGQRRLDLAGNVSLAYAV